MMRTGPGNCISRVSPPWEVFVFIERLPLGTNKSGTYHLTHTNTHSASEWALGEFPLTCMCTGDLRIFTNLGGLSCNCKSTDTWTHRYIHINTKTLAHQQLMVGLIRGNAIILIASELTLMTNSVCRFLNQFYKSPATLRPLNDMSDSDTLFNFPYTPI